jgi:hypothetical protein
MIFLLDWEQAMPVFDGEFVIVCMKALDQYDQ